MICLLIYKFKNFLHKLGSEERGCNIMYFGSARKKRILAVIFFMIFSVALVGSVRAFGPQITDVTPKAFSVLWTADPGSTPGIILYESSSYSTQSNLEADGISVVGRCDQSRGGDDRTHRGIVFGNRYAPLCSRRLHHGQKGEKVGCGALANHHVAVACISAARFRFRRTAHRGSGHWIRQRPGRRYRHDVRRRPGARA